MSDTTQTPAWGFAAVTTIAALIVLCVACGSAIALFWARTYSDPIAMTHTLVLFAIVVDTALIVLIAAALCRRPS